METPLLIVSIFGPSHLNPKWFALQRHFIARTTDVPYRFAVVLNGVDRRDLPGADVLSESSENRGHGPALTDLLEQLKAEAHKTYLILDSDCFPITLGWHEVLLEQLRRFGKLLAAPVRIENLDLFPHPSAVFFERQTLLSGKIDFRDKIPGRNLIGKSVLDVGSAMADLDGNLLPLLRTNVINLHPVAAAIYHHLFYHHGAGSRAFYFRVLREFQYHDHWFDSGPGAQQQERLLSELMKDPDEFIAYLVGEREPRLAPFLCRQPLPESPSKGVSEHKNPADTIHWLHVEVAQRDRTIVWLHAEVAKRDATIARLQAEQSLRGMPVEAVAPGLAATSASQAAPQSAPEFDMTLAQLATIYGTDKLEHDYLDHYERHFGPLRELPLEVLEIGIREGGSLRMWRDYFPRGVIHGLDIADCEDLAEARIRVYRGDQTDVALLHRIGGQGQEFDIVIDDGSHVNRDVLTSFEALFPRLRSGGLYVIEDVHTSYWSAYGGQHLDLNSGRTTVSFVKELVDGLNGHWIPGRAPRELDATIASLHCYPKLVFIAKGTNAARHRPHELEMMRKTLSGGVETPPSRHGD